jgi:hypothetical protein
MKYGYAKTYSVNQASATIMAWFVTRSLPRHVQNLRVFS